MPESDDKFEMPDNLPTDRTELDALLASAEGAFTARYAKGATTSDDIVELRGLAEGVRSIRAAIASDEEGGEDEPEEVEEAPEEPAEPVEEPEVPAEPEDKSAASAVLETMLLEVADAPAPAAEAPIAVAASAIAEALVAALGQIKPAEPAKPAPAPVVVHEVAPEFEMQIAAPSPIVITASADIPGVPHASNLDGMNGLVAAVMAKAGTLTNQPGRGVKYPVATISKPLSSDRNLDGLSQRDQMDKMAHLASLEFLLASGGWCAPSEISYELACEVEAAPEMLVLPTGTVSRGGLKFPISPSFRDFYALENNGLFTWTEADDILAAGNPHEDPDDDRTKPCFKIPCVDFDEARLELEGLCVTAGNLMDKAYPELIRRYLSLVLNGHLHRMNARKIAKALAFSEDDVTIAGTFGAASSLLSALELQVADLRDQFSMDENATIEGMLPRWTRDVIRIDVARRENKDLETVSNGEIKSYLQDSGVMIQFVSDWQLMGDPDNPATEWPDEVTALLWLPGALRELTGPSWDIAVARDSVLNETNDYTVAFTEESYQVYKPGCGVRTVTVPVCPSGAVGERVELVCASDS